MPGPDEMRGPDAGPPAPRRDEVMTPEERAALAKDVQEQVPAIVDESEAAVRAMLNDDGSMTKPLAMAYVQQKAIDLFDDLAAGYRLAAENQQAPEVDRKDAALCATCCDEAATAMRLATTMLLRSQERVQVAPATATPIRVPGSKLPRGGR